MSSSPAQGLELFPEPIADPERRLDPFPWFQRMRQEAPIHYDERRQAWDVFLYEDVTAVLEDSDTFSSDGRNASTYEPPDHEFGEAIFESMLFSDPPRHGDRRGMAADFFTPDQLQSFEPRIREVTTEFVEEAMQGGSMDVVEDLAYPVPAVVIGEILGVPPEDHDQFRRMAFDLVSSGNPLTDDLDDQMDSIMATQQELAMYFTELIEQRTQEPQDDLISHALETEIDGRSPSTEELVGLSLLLITAGNVTTAQLITNAVRCFDEHPSVYDAIRGDENKLRTAIEEVLRYRPPSPAVPRVAVEDTELRGQEIAAGDPIIAWTGSANRDEEQFTDADTFVPDRSPNKHLGFGSGIHYCLGAPLARLEAKVVLSTVLDRIEDIELRDDDLEPVDSALLHGVQSLPIEFDRPR